MRQIAYALCAFSFFAPSVANAQGAPVEPADAPIVVTGHGLATTPGKAAYGTQAISREQLTSTASGRIEDALGKVAGLQQFRRSDSRSANPSAQGITLRGLGGNASSRALVLLDGVPLADPFFGYIPFSSIDPNLLSSAVVTRGGGTGAFGAGAVAGTVELESANARQLGLLSGGAFVNDRGETELSAAVAPELGNGFAVLSGRWDRGQGFWTTPVSQRNATASVRARYDSWSAGLRGAAQIADDLELQARIAAFDDHRTLRFKGADSTSSGQDASLRLVGRGHWQFDLLGYVQARDFSNVVISASSFRKTLDQRRTPSTGIGGKFEIRPPVDSNHVLRLGADLRIADGEMLETGFASSGAVTKRRRAGGRNADLGFYLENDWSVGPMVLTGGARLDRWTIRNGSFEEEDVINSTTTTNRFADRSGWQASVRGGALIRVADALKLRVAGYTGHRQPTLNELYRPFVVFPVTTEANAALANEKLRGYEAGIDLDPLPGVQLSVTAFDNRVTNAIVNVTDPANDNLRKRRNVDAVKSRGLEASVKASFKTVELNGSVSWTDAKLSAAAASTKLDGKRPAQTPELAAYAGVQWHPAERWTVAASVRHVGAQYEDDLEKDILKAATTVDAFVEVPAGPATVILRAENLFDEEIVTRNSSNTIDLGAPRTIWIGIRSAF